MRLRFAFPAILLLALPGRASAQDAVTLFTQGRALVEKSKWAEACPLFAEAHRLQREAIGITMNLADCYAHTGKTASAWSAYREAEFLAKKANDTARADYAHEQGAALEPRLSHLRIDAEPTPGLILHRDEQEIGKAVLGTSFPVDPGSHKIEATAPGYLVWSTTVIIGPERDEQVVRIPALGKAPPGAGEGGGSGAPSGPFVWMGQRIAGLGVGLAGVAGLAVGGALGGLAISKNNASKADCSPVQPALCHADGVSLRQTAGTFADASTGALIGGGVALVAGIAVFATGGPKGGAKVGGVRGVEVVPVVGAGTTGLWVGGTW